MALPVSVLNLVPIRHGSDTLEAIADMVALLKGVERLGYRRYWISEHHNMENLVSSATVTLIQHALAHSTKIHVGSGGIMLPNHSPLVVAEQFGTLATLYPKRVELGLGRAPGTDRRTMAALRRSPYDTSHSFAQDIQDLQRYFSDAEAQTAVVARPGVATHVPLYILGSSTDSAHLAASLGLPYVFATHFAPQMVGEAAAIYRQEFQPSSTLAAPYFMVCLNVVVAETDAEAQYLDTSSQQFQLGVIKNERKPLAPPVDDMNLLWSKTEARAVEAMHAGTLCGSEASVREQLQAWREWLQFNEVMVVNYIYDRALQLDSFARFKAIADKLE